MNTLIIWENVPESLTLYIIPNEIADKYRNFLEQAHGTYINSGKENEGTNFVNNAIAEGKYEEYEGSNEDYHGLFASYKVNGEAPVAGVDINYVYYTGFLL